MVIARTDHGEIRTLEKLGEKVQLAAGLDKQGHLDELSQERALNCLKQFSQRLEGLGADAVQIVATNALRVAKNRKTFVRKAEQIIGYPIEIISGREEARLIYLGVSHSLADDYGNRLVIDIGGGSTEFVIGERFEPKATESLHMGCVSYRDRFFASGEITAGSLDRAVQAAASELLAIKKSYQRLGWDSCVGSSGSIRSVLQAAVHLGLSEDSLDLDILKRLRKEILAIGDVSKLGKLGIREDRLSIFPSGFAILYAAFQELRIEKMKHAHGALREGVLYDMIGRIQHEDVRERTIRSLQTRYGLDESQSTRVETTVLNLFRQVAQSWSIAEDQNLKLLSWASKVYEIGLTISHTQYHKHGDYLIRHSDLAGFSRDVQSHLATLVRLHRRKLISDSFEDMEASEAIVMKRLCILFRLAVVLTCDRSDANIECLIAAKADHVCLKLSPQWVIEHPLNFAKLEEEQEYLRKSQIELELLTTGDSK